MKRSLTAVIRFDSVRFALACAVLCLLLFLGAPGQALAQAEPGPMRPSSASQDTGNAPPQAQPRQTMRPSGVGAWPSDAIQLASLVQELDVKYGAALAGWQDSTGASRKPKILVLDFCTWDNQWPPFGAWLADNLSAALASGAGDFEIIDRAQLASSLQERHLAPKDEMDSRKVGDLAQSLGADLLVEGRFSALGNDLGLTINLRRALAIEHPRPVIFIKSRVVMSNEIAGHLGESLDSLGPRHEDLRASASDAYVPGRNGVSYPRCWYCPAAEFPPGARRNKLSGTVTLSVLVNADGYPSDIQVTESAETALDQQAIETVKKWRFDPAKDSNGLPVAVHEAIEVTFN
ncbi:MAG: TonB family protein [Candidatus Acidiferrales bacterium]